MYSSTADSPRGPLAQSKGCSILLAGPMLGLESKGAQSKELARCTPLAAPQSALCFLLGA